MLGQTSPREAFTSRLTLRVPSQTDRAELFDLYSHPQVWAADPLSRHIEQTQTDRMIENWRAAWDRDGLGMWVARSNDTGDFVGIGGCFVRYGDAWNLGYRLMPSYWQQGYAQEISLFAVAWARRVRPELPMTAYLLEGNDRSQRTLERIGLRMIWRGPDAGNPDKDAVRLLYSDRDLPDTVTKVLTEN